MVDLRWRSCDSRARGSVLARMRLAVAFLWVIAGLAGKLILGTIRLVAYMMWVSGLFGAAILLLQGVAQLEGEALARVPETAAAVRGRLIIVGLFFAAAFCGWLVRQVVRFVSAEKRGDYRSRLLRAVFEGSVFWAGTCLFFCLLVLAGSLQARWKVADRKSVV